GGPDPWPGPGPPLLAGAGQHAEEPEPLDRHRPGLAPGGAGRPFAPDRPALLVVALVVVLDVVEREVTHQLELVRLGQAGPWQVVDGPRQAGQAALSAVHQVAVKCDHVAWLGLDHDVRPVPGFETRGGRGDR